MADETAQPRKIYTPRANNSAAPRQRSTRLSFILLGFAAVLSLGVTSWLGFLNQRDDVTLEAKEIKIVNAGEVELTGARYRGLSPSGKPYEITASQANEAQDGSGRVDMTLPTAVITLHSGSIVNLQSDKGVFNKQSDIVNLSGTVTITQPDRNLRLNTEALQADLKAGNMQSDVPVLVQDSNRRINADSMQAFDNGARIIFGGAARMIINHDDS